MKNQITNRRDFFRKVAQLSFLTVLAGGSVYLLSEKRIQLDGCGDSRFCKSCRELKTCSLDQAKNFRKNER